MPGEQQPFTLSSYPRAILHVDGDAFFTSVEQALHPAWRGKPMVTGKERGIIACASYEAKKLGIKRGIRLHEAMRMCPDLIVLPSDYETYSIFSRRMFNILRRYTPLVEESSIDEGFADITGLRRVYRTSYEEIAQRIQAEIQADLDLTVSIGLGPGKVLAKMASKFRKPNGFTAVPGYGIHLFLQKHTLQDIWGIGPNTTQMLQKQGLLSAFDFAARTERWADRVLGKIGRELWRELRGEAVYPIQTEPKTDYATISKCKTFTSPSSDREFVYTKLVRNVESACIKLRRYKLRAKFLVVALRRKNFSQTSMEAHLTRATSAPQEMLPLVKELFDKLFEPGEEYRTTLVVMAKLEDDRVEQGELFEDRPRIERMNQASRAMDLVHEQFGKHRLCLGPGLLLGRHRITYRDDAPERKTKLLPGETPRQRLGLPWMAIRV